jgi:hypothetical protein
MSENGGSHSWCWRGIVAMAWMNTKKYVECEANMKGSTKMDHVPYLVVGTTMVGYDMDQCLDLHKQGMEFARA